MPRLTQAELEALIDQHYPTWRNFTSITKLDERELEVRMPFRSDILRAGGTVSGPAMMALADTTAYYLILAHAQLPGMATANLDIHFLVRPKPQDVIAHATLIRLGRRLAVATVDLRSGDDLVAHATVTYALPQH